MKKCLVYLDLDNNDIIFEINENENSYHIVGIKNLKDICKNLNNPEKVEI